MFRFILVACFLLGYMGVSAQNVNIPKSSDMVVIKGKSYYLHTVQAGQTLFSIAKAYGVKVEDLKVLNEKENNTISLYEVLKIPYIDNFVRQDNEYYYHKAERGETLYSIARLYNVKPRKLIKSNEELSRFKTLSVGSTVRIPLVELSYSVLKKLQKEQELTLQLATADKKEPIEKKEPVLSGENSILPDAIHKDSAKVISSDGVADTMSYPGLSERADEEAMSGSSVKVALLLPLYAEGYPAFEDTLYIDHPVKIENRSVQFLQFYEGILLAVDSLKNKGYCIDLSVFDTEKSVYKMTALAEKINRLNPDLIIGPVYGSVFKALSDRVYNKNIPFVYPLSSRQENFGDAPNILQVNAPFNTLARKMIDWLRQQADTTNTVYITFPAQQKDEDFNLFNQQMAQLPGVQSFHWDFAQQPLAELKAILSLERQNVVVIPANKEAEVSKILPSLTVLAEDYPITVIGFPEWQTFTSIDHETYFKLNTHLFTYSYIDNYNQAAKDFAMEFRKYFYTEPVNIAFKAYDMGLYFMELVAKYRDRALDAIEYSAKDGLFSKFRFVKKPYGAGKENQGFFVITFSNDYQVKVESF